MENQLPVRHCNTLSSVMEVLTESDARLVLQLIHLLQAPSDKPCIATVIDNFAISLAAFSSSLPKEFEKVRAFSLDLQRIADAFQKFDNTDLDVWQPHAMYYRTSTHPAWSLFASYHFREGNAGWLKAVGAIAAKSLVLVQRFSCSAAKELARLHQARQQPTTANGRRPEIFFKRQCEVATAICKAAEAVRSTEELEILRTAVDVRSNLIGQLHFAPADACKAAPNLQEQAPQEVRATAEHLRICIEAGNLPALVHAVAFLIGMPLDTACEIPFLTDTLENWAIAIDVQQGVIMTDLSEVLKHTAAPDFPGCLPANRIVVRPLPRFIHQALITALGRLAARPATLGAIDPDRRAKRSRKLSHDLNPDARIRSSVARFIAARGSAAIATGIDRGLAMYLTNDFTKAGKAKNYYICIEREEIWNAASRYFAWLGWGEPAALAPGPAAGSAVMPLEDHLMKRDQWMCDATAALRPGRRYRLESLETHHNCYALLCASRVAFCLSARHAAAFRLLASGFAPDALFTLLPDKRVGLLAGRSPAFLPRMVQEQVNLWFTHCQALDSRLERQGVAGNGEVRRHLRSILERHQVPLFFQYRKGRVHWVGSQDISSWLPAELGAKEDAGRHFWQNALRRAGLQSTDIDQAVRHQTQGIEAYSSVSCGSVMATAMRVTAAQDQIISGLGMQAVAGLARGK